MKPSRAAGSLSELEGRLGYTFKGQALLVRALTHMSHGPGQEGSAGSYQRLEFLGDHVLGLAVAALLFETFPTAEEGELSRRLAGLVRKETCADVAAAWDVSGFIRVGENEAQNGSHAKPAIMGDVCEAIIGAVFLDGGFAAAEAAVRRAWTSRMMTPSRPLRDPKTALQEWSQGLGRPAPLYRETRRQGPAHAPHFTVEVQIEGFAPEIGIGPSKRAAEQSAAQAFMARESIATTVARE